MAAAAHMYGITSWCESSISVYYDVVSPIVSKHTVTSLWPPSCRLWSHIPLGERRLHPKPAPRHTPWHPVSLSAVAGHRPRTRRPQDGGLSGAITDCWTDFRKRWDILISAMFLSELQVHVGPIRSTSVGWLKLKSTSPLDHPLLQPNYLSTGMTLQYQSHQRPWSSNLPSFVSFMFFDLLTFQILTCGSSGSASNYPERFLHRRRSTRSVVPKFNPDPRSNPMPKLTPLSAKKPTAPTTRPAPARWGHPPTPRPWWTPRRASWDWSACVWWTLPSCRASSVVT